MNFLEGERFYWLNKICNKSEKKGEGTRLLQFVIDTLEKRNATIGLIADPDMQHGRDILQQQILRNRLINWYMRHGFQSTGSRYHVLVRPSDIIHHSGDTGTI